jgi:hypothetical protein
MIAQRPTQLKIAENGVVSQFEFRLTSAIDPLLPVAFPESSRSLIAGGPYTHWKSAAFSRRTPFSALKVYQLNLPELRIRSTPGNEPRLSHLRAETRASLDLRQDASLPMV